jgi:hypothetical protein
MPERSWTKNEIKLPRNQIKNSTNPSSKTTPNYSYLMLSNKFRHRKGWLANSLMVFWMDDLENSTLYSQGLRSIMYLTFEELFILKSIQTDDSNPSNRFWMLRSKWGLLLAKRLIKWEMLTLSLSRSLTNYLDIKENSILAKNTWRIASVKRCIRW